MTTHAFTRRTLFLAMALFVAMVSLGTPGTSGAYVPIVTPSGKNVFWKSMPVSWSYNHNGFTQIAQAQMVSILQNAFKQWEGPVCTSFRTNYLGTTTTLWSKVDLKNVVTWHTASVDPALPTALAITFPNYNTAGDYLDADIIFNSSYSWSDQPFGQQYDMIGTSVHEIGHFLGLNHTTDPNSTMFPTANSGVCPCRTLKQDDISGVCALYPSGSNPGSKKLGEVCDAQSPCDTGLFCTVLQQGATSGVCLQVCPTAGVSCGSGEKCYPVGGTQTNVCACQSDADCVNGKTCVSARCTGGTGSRNVGETCDLQNLCSAGLLCVVLQQGSPTGTCFTACPAGTCASGEKCYQIQGGGAACICQGDADCTGGKKCVNNRCSAGTPGTKKLGEVCDAQNLCETGLACVVTAQGATSGLCLALCQGTAACPTGEKCTSLGNGQSACACATNADCSNGKTCQQFRCTGGGTTPGQEGGPCTAAGTCEPGLNCLKDPQDASRTLCIRPCQSHAQCINGWACDEEYKACVPAGPQKAGQTCDGASLCLPGLVCIIAQQGATSGLCLTACKPPNNNLCTGGEPCQQRQGRSDGVCACTADSQCPNGGRCQNLRCTGGTTTGCKVDTECKSTEICRNGACVVRGSCVTAADCPAGQVCNASVCGLPGTEIPPPDSDGGTTSPCSPACPTGQTCQSGRCVASKECQTDGQCSAGFVCRLNTCQNAAVVEPPKTGCSCSALGETDVLPLTLFLFLLAFVSLRRGRG